VSTKVLNPILLAILLLQFSKMRMEGQLLMPHKVHYIAMNIVLGAADASLEASN
jgi:hypothetical protein